MRVSKFAIAGLFMALSSPAFAVDTYCRGVFLPIYDGADQQTDWTVTTSRSRKVQLPGQAKPTTGCNYNLNFLGGIIKFEIATPPRLGKARIVNRSRMFYESATPGSDTLTTKITWADARTGKINTALTRIRVTVVDGPQ